MFFILSKILLFLTYPFSWIIGTFVFSILLRKKKIGRKLWIVGLSMMVFFSNTVVFCEFARHWEVQGKKITDLPIYDCAIVLTGMASYNNDLERLSLGSNGDRIWQAIDLYHKGKVKKILITGDSGLLTDRGLHEAKQFGETIRKWKIPAKDIIVEGFSQNTHENAKFSSELLQKKYPELKSFLLVTSAIHMKRSLACFTKENVICTAFSTNHFTGQNRSHYLEQFILPNSQVIGYWESLTKEWVGYLMYWFAGYV